MALATITTKGQVTIPKAIRDSLKLNRGDRIGFIVIKEGEALVRPISKRVDDVFGKLHKPGRKAATVEEMCRAIAERIKRASE